MCAPATPRSTLPVPIREGQFDSYNVPASVTGPILGQTAKVNTELEKVTAMFATESDPGWSPRSRFEIPLEGEYPHSDPFRLAPDLWRWGVGQRARG